MRLALSTVRVSFYVASIAIIEVPRFAPLESAATLPRRLALFFEQAHLFLLPLGRERACPKVVKPGNSKYRKKMPASS